MEEFIGSLAMAVAVVGVLALTMVVGQGIVKGEFRPEVNINFVDY
jgi:hypothetical protein